MKEKESPADILLPLHSRTVPGLSYWLLTSHNCNSQITQLKIKSNLCYDRLTVRQSVLVSIPTWGSRTDFCYCKKFAGLLMTGRPIRGVEGSVI
jgi:hypothetical protein